MSAMKDCEAFLALLSKFFKNSIQPFQYSISLKRRLHMLFCHHHVTPQSMLISALIGSVSFIARLARACYNRCEMECKNPSRNIFHPALLNRAIGAAKTFA